MSERFDNLDGLRTISCICIIAMHIRANANFVLSPVLDKIVASWTHFVPLFLMISGFGMCCGYYEKFKSGEIDLNRFYTRRYHKILPFYVTLILLDIVINRALPNLIEGVTEATLVFGLLPNNELSVIGVSWTLGVIFLFYMLFPFIVFLFWTKRRALFAFGTSIMLSLFCSEYFFTDKFVIESFSPRHNFLYCTPYILGGGIVFLYRKELIAIVSRYKWIWLAGCVSLTIAWYFIPTSFAGMTMLKNLLLFLPWLIYAISVESRILNNKVTYYLSGISLEMYLAQMLLFRVVEKSGCLYLLGHGWLDFLFVCVVVVIGLIIFIEIWKRLWSVAVFAKY